MEYAREALVAKLSAKRAYALSVDDFFNIDKLHGRRELIAYLKRLPTYSKSLSVFVATAGHRPLEEQLITSLFYDFASILSYLPKDIKTFLKALFAKHEAGILKRVLHNCLDSKPPMSFVHFDREVDKLFSVNIRRLMDIYDKTALFSFLRNTPYSYLALRFDDTPLSELENMLDIKYFTDIFKAISKIENDIDRMCAKAIYGAKIDLTNFSWIWRMKENFGVNPNNLVKYLIPVNGALHEGVLQQLIAARDKGTVLKVINDTIYGKYYKDLQPQELEYAISSVPYKTAKRLSQKHPRSIATIIYYFLAREREIKRILSIIECKNYKVDTEALISTWRSDDFVNH